MRLYGAIEKVEAQADGTVKVHGIASTESTDDQGEVVKADAMRAALPDYMRFPAVREMHQLQAAGTALEADVGDDDITRIVAHIVDPTAVAKVKNQVYRGFSIGGRVTQREPGNPKTITGLVLNEISLVDRPANPEAIFDCWKASMAGPPAAGSAAPNAPVQIWACGVPNHQHRAKAEAIKCLEKRAAAGASGVEVLAKSEPTDPAEIDKRATEGATALQTAMDAALAAVETGEVILPAAIAKTGDGDGTPLPVTYGTARELVTLISADSGQQAAKGGDAPGDGSKPYGDVEYADPGYQSDGKKRYPVDTERHIRAAWNYLNKPTNAGKYSSEHLSSIKSRIIAAWKDKIDSDGPPSASEKASRANIAKSLWDIGDIAMMIAALRRIEENLELEAAMEGDESSAPAKARDCCAQLCQFLRDLVAEETAEVLEGTEIDEPVGLSVKALHDITDAILKSIPDPQKAESLVTTLLKAGAKHSARDQHILDLAAAAVHKAMNLASVTKGDRMHLADCHKAVLDAGATDLGADGREMLTDSNPEQGAGSATQHSTTDTGHNATGSAPNPTGAVPATPQYPGVAHKAATTLEILEALLSAPGADVEKAGAGHRPLLQIAHDCLKAFSDGATCKADGEKPSRHSGATMACVDKAHFHLTKCDGMAMACKALNEQPSGAPTPAGEAEGQGTSTTAGGEGTDAGEPGKDAATAEGDLAKTAEPPAATADPSLADIAKTVTEMAQGLASLAQQNKDLRARVEDIAQTPLPPRAIQRVAAGAGLTKGQDNGGLTGGPVDVTDQLAEMSDDEVTKTLIKRSFRRPLVVHGFTDGPGPLNAPRS
jgi:tRNA threonylcarbamoyladenosine modification (KEOPS) complex Cgi121 subunit